MWWVPVLVPTIAGVLIGALARLFARGRVPEVGPGLRTAIILAAGIPAAWLIARQVAGILQLHHDNAVIDLFQAASEYRFLIPVALGIIAMLVIGLAARRRHVPGSADLTPRNPMTFASRPAVVVLAVAVAASTVLAVVLGRASTPSDMGSGSVYIIEARDSAVETPIYGWAESVPTLIALGLLCASAWTMLALIARPRMAPQVEVDRAERRYRSKAVLTVGLAAVLGHLAVVVGNAAEIAHVQIRTVSHVETEPTQAWFAPLGTSLQLMSWILVAVSVALWVAVVLSAVPLRRRTARALDAA